VNRCDATEKHWLFSQCGLCRGDLSACRQRLTARHFTFEAPIVVARRHRARAGADIASVDLPGGTQSIQRAVAVLRILATARETGLGLTEISKQAELTRPTAHRILGVLVGEGIVEQRPNTRRYVLGEQIPLLSLSRRTRDPLLEIVRPHLRAAVDEIGDTGFLTRRTGA
jgi:hypothetical protein